jgi:N-acetylglucosamine-6-phosphate deacetylase
MPTPLSRPAPQALALTNGRVVLPGEVVDGLAVIVAAGKILGLAPAGELGRDIEQLDVGGRLITPGLIDIHTHGAAGRSFNEPSLPAWETIASVNAAHGVTALLATLATDSLDNLLACLELARQMEAARQRQAAPPPSGAESCSPAALSVLGVHLEGPYFSLEQKGAQNPAHLRIPADGSAEALLAYWDVLRMVTYAPELPGALELTSCLAALGIVPAAGHSSARDSQVLAAMARGLRHCVHIWSGQSLLVREGPWRRPGLLEATLAFDQLTAEMIADNRHLPPTLMQLAYKCKGPDRLCIVSDAISGAGLPEGTRFELCGLACEVRAGVAMLLDRTAFAGSTTLLNQMLPILIEQVGIPLAEAVRMASLTPARVIGCEQRKGSLEAGKDADIAIFEADFSAWRTMIGGQWA